MERPKNLTLEDCIIVLLLNNFLSQQKISKVMKIGINAVGRAVNGKTANSRRARAFFDQLKALETLIFPARDEPKEETRPSILSLELQRMFSTEAGWDTLGQKKAEEEYKSKNRYTGY